MWVRFPARAGPFLHSVQADSRGEPVPYPIDNSGSFKGGHEGDRSPTSSAEVKNTWSKPPLLIRLQCVVPNFAQG
jgi:hypothetical protein